MIRNILLDLDGVCADFFTPALNRLNHNSGKNISPEEYIESGLFDMAKMFGISKEDFWKQIDFGRFWIDLPAFPWHKDLFELLSGVAPITIASSPSPWIQCVPQKLLWIKEHLGLTEESCMFGPRKYLMANPETLLIDDLQKNCDEFIAHGGKAICIPSNWNTKDLTFAKVLAAMKEFKFLVVL